MTYCVRYLVGLLCVALQVLAFRSSVGIPNNSPPRVRLGLVHNHHGIIVSSQTRLFLADNTEPSTTMATPRRRTRPVNLNVRNLMDLIRGEFSSGGDTNTNTTFAWTKTRNYLYRTTKADDSSNDNSNNNKLALTVHQVQHVLTFLRNNFPPDTCRVILQSSPRILRKNCGTFLQPTTDFLRQLYRDDMLLTAIHRNPDLLLTSGMGYDADALELVEVFLGQELQLTSQNMAKLKRTAPFVFQLPVYKLLSVLNVLTQILLAGGYQDQETKSILTKLVLSHPHILQLSVESNLQPRLEFLKERCHLQTSDLAVLVKGSSASVLALSVKENLEPTIAFLTDLLSGRPDPASDLRKCLRSHPQLLGLSLKNLHSKKAYFDALDHSSSSSSPSSSLASRVLVRSPAVYSLSLDGNIVPTIEFLARVWGTKAPPIRSEDNANGNEKSNDEPMGQVTEHNDGSVESGTVSQSDSLASLLSEYPSILTLSLEGNIQPTVNFYNRTGYIHLDGDWNLLRRHSQPGKSKSSVIRGRYIAASLFNRLLPRWHYCRSVVSPTSDNNDDEGGGNNSDVGLGEDNDYSAVPVIPLHVLVSAKDPAFCEQMGIDHDEYCIYMTNSIPRLKFSSQFDTWLKTGRPIDL
jgi:hypothetical protein